MKTVKYLLIMLIIGQSCVVYQKTSVPLSESYDKGKVKVMGIKKTHKYENIKLIEGVYYGIKSNEVRSGYFVRIKERIDTTNTISFYLPEIVAYKAWLSLANGKEINGILYEVNDSSIVIATIDGTDYTTYKNKIESYKSERYSRVMYPISSIEMIKTRRLNSVGTGALIGFAIGAIPALAASESLALGATIVFVSIPLGLIGTLFGSVKLKISINGSIDNYNKNKYQLRQIAINR